MSVFPCQQLHAVLQAEEATENKEIGEQRGEEGGRGVLWWLWDTFLGASPEVKIESCGGNLSSTILSLSVLLESLVTQGHPQDTQQCLELMKELM